GGRCRPRFTFSEPMDRPSTQAAYQSADLNAASVTVEWNAASTVLTVRPSAPLALATGTDPATPARRYAFKLTDTAHDLAGNPLAAFESSFTTLRDLTLAGALQAAAGGYVRSDGLVEAPSDDFLAVGDDVANVGYRSFLSFDLSALPDGALPASVVAATLNLEHEDAVGSPFTALNDCTGALCSPYTHVQLDQVNYGAGVSNATYDTPVVQGLDVIDSFRNGPYTALAASVTAAVQDVLAHRAERGGRVQFRLSFPLATNNDSRSDYVFYRRGLNAGDPIAPSLSVHLLIP
ncbi:MAG TPA: Ig-like domain-containing protein, partial [Deinococcales bacterium]|nr:Ig-like domain-containing protein [Deinococcales bacterium]